MTHLHFDCFSGVSGDMVLGALVDAGLPIKELARALKRVPAAGYALSARAVRRSGVRATQVDVRILRGFEAPLSVKRIHRLVASSRLPAVVKARAREVFERLTRAEGAAHGISPARVHFHEVGVVDSIVDVVGTIAGCHLLGVSRVTASPVNVGSGMISAAHGRLPVPGPATAELARGVPVYAAGPERELATPTGLALLAVLADEFGPLPLMRVKAVGCGAGSADPEGWPNVLRVFLGEPVAHGDGATDAVVQIETNLDDLNPQAYDTVMARLFAAGALDVTLTPVIMKLGRPGVMLTALAPRERAETVGNVVLRETTTLGIRVQEVIRRVLPRRMDTVRISGGTVRMKVAATTDGVRKVAPEYRDCRAIAERTGRPIREVMESALVAYAARARMKKGKTSTGGLA